MATKKKGDQEDRFFGINWEDDLDGDTISASSWIVPDGLVKTGEVYDNSTSAVRLSGGVVGERYDVTNLIETNSRGETLEATIRIVVVADRYVE